MDGFILTIGFAACLLAWYCGDRVSLGKRMFPKVWWSHDDPFNDKKPPPA